MPSRFLLDSTSALGHERHIDGQVDHADADGYSVVASFAAGIARVAFPATAQEYRLRALFDHTRAGRHVRDHELVAADAALRLGLDVSLARSSSQFTRFDGNLAGLSAYRPTHPDIVLSPTRLQTYAACPFDYYLAHILRVDIPEQPEERYELSLLDRGNLVHETLDEFLGEVLTRPTGAPSSDLPWTDADRLRLQEIGAKHCAAYETQGLTGRRLFWHRDRRRVLADLDRFLTEDALVRAAYGLQTVATELRFGFTAPSAPPVEIALSDGRTLRFRGAADRVDRTGGDSLWVIDYKTGRPREIDPDDPTAAGTMLQLPVYAHAARSSFGDEQTPVGASYWYVTTKGGFRWAELSLTPDVDHRVDEVLRTIVDGIDAGAFPCRVDPPSAWSRRVRSYTDPDARGTRDRAREWLRKRDVPELQQYLALAEPALAGDRSHAEASGGNGDS
jgi:RecB family exonuclease